MARAHWCRAKTDSQQTLVVFDQPVVDNAAVTEHSLIELKHGGDITSLLLRYGQAEFEKDQGRELEELIRFARLEHVHNLFATLDPLEPNSCLFLADAYEQSLRYQFVLGEDGQQLKVESSRQRKSQGSYYTPRSLVESLVSESFECLGQDVERATVLDPACGAGVFLVECFRRLLVQRPSVDDLEQRLCLLKRHIFGVDLDPIAVEVARRVLTLAAGSNDQAIASQLASNIRCGDALIADRNVSEHALTWSDVFHEQMQAGGFDLVIGNPPWVSYSGRQAEPLVPAHKVYYRKHYTCSTWMTAHSLFVEAAVRDWSKRCVAFVLPDQVGHLDGYAHVRGLVGSRLKVLRYWGEGVFDDATTPVLSFVYDARHTGDALCVDHAGVLSEQSFHSDEAWNLRGKDRFFESIMAQGESLGTAIADPGVHTGNCSKKIVVSEPQGDWKVEPVLEGKQVSAYCCDTPKKWLRLDYVAQGDEYFTIRKRERYLAAPFVVRQTAAYPIVGPRRGATYFRNSLLALYPPDDERGLHYVVGILNSKLMRWVYRKLCVESQQKAFPQVKVGTLRKLPIKRPSSTAEKLLHDQLADKVRKMLEEPTSVLCDEIEASVFQLYGLNPEQVATIESELEAML